MSTNSSTDISTRLRRAIAQNDLLLVQRVLRNNPKYLQNTDHNDDCNTSLHLAAQKGQLEIAEHLISLGHDASAPAPDFIYHPSPANQGTSFNSLLQTPLHLAASNAHVSLVELLCQHFPQTINHADRQGLTALHHAARAHPLPATASYTHSKASASASLDAPTAAVSTLLANAASPHATDKLGNTPLHYASAWGNLKAVRLLIQAGADPLVMNYKGWSVGDYSISVQAEVYVRNLVGEWDRRRAAEQKMNSNNNNNSSGSNAAGRVLLDHPSSSGGSATDEHGPRRVTRILGGTPSAAGGAVAGGVRLVQAEPEDDEEDQLPDHQVFEDARSRAGSGTSRDTTTASDAGSMDGLGIRLAR